MQSAVVAVFSTLDDASAILIRLLIAVIIMLFVHLIFALILLAWAAAFILIAIYFFSPIHEHLVAASVPLGP